MIWRGWLMCLALVAMAAERGFTVVVVEENANQVVLFASDHPEERTFIPVGFRPHEVAVSGDGRFAYVSNFGLSDAKERAGTPGNTISVIDIKQGIEVRQFTLNERWRAPHGVKLRPGKARELFTNVEVSDQMIVLDTKTGDTLRRFPVAKGVHNFLFAQDGLTLYASAVDGAIYQLSAIDGKELARVNIGSPVRGMCWTADGQHLLATGWGELVELSAGLAVERRMKVEGTTLLLYPAARGDRWYVPAVYEHTIVVMDARTGKEVGRIGAPGPLGVQFAPDGRRAYVPNVGPTGDRITVIDLGTEATTDVMGFQNANGLGFSGVGVKGKKR